jgi:uncharacterized membrane protein YkvA (DUF1232 family)
MSRWDRFFNPADKEGRERKAKLAAQLFALLIISTLAMVLIDPVDIPMDVLATIGVFTSGVVVSMLWKLVSVEYKTDRICMHCDSTDEKIKSVVDQNNLNWAIANDNWEKKKGAKKYRPITL